MSLRTEVIRILNELFSNSKKITQLDDAGALAGDELVEVVQNGVNKKTTTASLTSGGISITDGNGTTADGTSVDLGGDVTGNISFSGDGWHWTWGGASDLMGDFRVWSDGDVVLDGPGSAVLQSDNNSVVVNPTSIDLNSNGTITLTTQSIGLQLNADGSLSLNGDPGTAGQVITSNGAAPMTWEDVPKKVIQVAFSDVTTAITTGTGKVTFRMPYAMTLTAVRCSLGTAQTSGSILTIDINESGASILSTKLTIDNTEKTSVTATTPAVISDSALADDAEITIDVDQVGDGTAKQGIITLIGV